MFKAIDFQILRVCVQAGIKFILYTTNTDILLYRSVCKIYDLNPILIAYYYKHQFGKCKIIFCRNCDISTIHTQ